MKYHNNVPTYIPPEDRWKKIWRYMDFTKFVSMLENNGLYFSRCDKLGDPFEGSCSNASEIMNEDAHLRFGWPIIDREFLSRYRKWLLQWAMLNCWHINDYESAAMWKLYSRTEEAIAIQSSNLMLKRCLMPEDVEIHEVEYVDYETGWISLGFNEYPKPFYCKRRSFQHEKELRALIQLPLPTKDGEPDLDAIQPLEGIWKLVDLTLLIDNIYVAPTSPKWFKELVEKITKRYSLNKNILQSSLDREPFF